MKNYKLSYYTIFTNPINEEGNRIVYSSRSGKTVVVTHHCADFLLSGLYEYIPESIKDLLIKNMIMVPEDEVELDTVIAENDKQIFGSKHTLYEVIQPSASCQLGCYYCGQEHTKTNLSEEIADKIVDRMVHKFENGEYKNIHIGWFGAEPLMGLPQMRLINSRLRERLPEIEITSKVVTNGLSLKENIFLELVKEFNVKRIEVTLDGTAEYHDKHRYTKSEGKSFDLIYKNLKKILLRDDFRSYQCQVTIRCNVDEKNVDGVEPLIDLLAADGLHKRIAFLYFIGVFSWGGNDAHKKSLTKEEMAKKNLEWHVRKMKLGYPMHNTVPSRKKTVCIAVGNSSEMYDAYGNVFNCTEVSYADYYNDTKYQLGSLKNDHLAKFEDKPHSDWLDTVHNTDQYPCHKCRIYPICGGTCPKSWAEGIPACPPLKYNLRKDLELKYHIKNTKQEDLTEKLDQFIDELHVDDFQRMETHAAEQQQKEPIA